MGERRGRDRRSKSQRRLERLDERRPLRIDPELVVRARQNSQPWRDLPRALAEYVVLLVLPRKLRIRAGLAVVIPEVLVSSEEPQSVAHDRTAEVCREIPVASALISALRLAA